MSELSRRNFLNASAAAMFAAGTAASARSYAANDKVGICVIGVNGRGGSHLDGFTDAPDSQVVAICDPDQRVLDRRSKQIKDKTGIEPKQFKDMREAFADDDIDAVSIATPNHWHTLATVWACQAGKDVYVEKPATHNVFEGKQLIAAAKKYNRIVQHGTQRRSDGRWIRDIGILHSGDVIGPVYMARGLGYKSGNRGELRDRGASEVPEYLDWRLWQGPASEQDYNPVYHPYNWHWFWHYGNGEIGNQGIHQLDVGAWGMNRGLPVKVYSTGGRYTYDDMGETPNTNVATFTYEDGTMFVFEVRNRWTNDEGGRMIDGKYRRGVDVGNLFYADGGYYVEGQGFFDERNEPIEVDYSKYPMPETKGPWQNFINAVKSRKQEDIYGNVEDAHVSSALAHLANTSYRLGRSLEFDPKSERYVNDDEANAMLTRQYAPGFEVPDLA